MRVLRSGNLSATKSGQVDKQSRFLKHPFNIHEALMVMLTKPFLHHPKQLRMKVPEVPSPSPKGCQGSTHPLFLTLGKCKASVRARTAHFRPQPGSPKQDFHLNLALRLNGVRNLAGDNGISCPDSVICN